MLLVTVLSFWFLGLVAPLVLAAEESGPNAISPTDVNDGGVNFIISGNHVVAIYDDGTRPEEINTNLLVPGITIGGGIIDDPNNRIYRGVNETAATGARDRVEVVHFAKPGTHLVICAIRAHFVNDGMYGFVVAK